MRATRLHTFPAREPRVHRLRPCLCAAGREGREFGAKSGLKKKKTGGLSNREKDKRKRLPMAARSGQVGGARSRLAPGRGLCGWRSCNTAAHPCKGSRG